MTTLDAAAHVSSSASRWGALMASPFDGGAMRAWTRLADWNDARITRSMLSRLSAHELDDIGLCRGDIEAIALRARR